MDFQRFLVAILLPVGKWPSLPPEQLHWSCCCLLSRAPSWAIQQSPDTIVVREGDPVTLECSASAKNFVNMYWYKLPVEKNATMQLVVYSVEGSKADIEKEFQNRFQSNGTKNNHLSVKIEHALLSDTGTYFCAEQDPQ
uniref:Ig-like domain-containing protein n=1 Tax=Ficedula albicollis TaxID=59894 RepID=A0A803VIL4_FICAL